MAWTPIAESGLAFSFSTASLAEMSGSVITAAFQTDPRWEIAFDEAIPRNVRVTIQAYDSQRVQGSEIPSFFEFYLEPPGDGDPVVVPNTIEGDTTEFDPNPVTSTGLEFRYVTGYGSELQRDESYTMLIEVDYSPTSSCQELGRVTRAVVSGYNRDRVHQSRLFPSEKRCLVANFNGAIPSGRTIDRVEWRLDVVAYVAMSNPSISGREVRVMIEACYWGTAAIRASVTLDNGEVYNQLFAVRVLDGPYFGAETTAAGPAVLIATA